MLELCAKFASSSVSCDPESSNFSSSYHDHGMVNTLIVYKPKTSCIDSLHNCSQLNQLILKNLVLEFLKSMSKSPLISPMYLTLQANFRITLHLMKSNGRVPLVNTVQKNLQSHNLHQISRLHSIMGGVPQFEDRLRFPISRTTLPSSFLEILDPSCHRS